MAILPVRISIVDIVLGLKCRGARRRNVFRPFNTQVRAKSTSQSTFASICKWLAMA
jgi:hypothetical protein